MQRLYKNAMAILNTFGSPTFFLTLACNPKWKVITDELLPGQKASDRPDLCNRVFHLKLEELKKDITDRKLLGTVKAYMYSIEF